MSESMEIVTDSAMPENTVFLLPTDVRMAIETAQHVESAYHKGRASREMLDAAVRYAEGVIRAAASEHRIGMITNTGEDTNGI